LGYYGQVPSAEFINGTNLASAVGLNSSYWLNREPVWCKFAFRGQVLYVAKTPLVNLISWNALNNLGIVDGSRIITINRRRYRVRLLTGLDNNESEWNNLIYRLSAKDPTGTFWERFTDAELVVGVGSGRTTWVQDIVNTYRVYRGYQSLTSYAEGLPTSATDTTGWRPVLELIP
jgi:hypothetical protein